MVDGRVAVTHTHAKCRIKGDLGIKAWRETGTPTVGVR